MLPTSSQMRSPLSFVACSCPSRDDVNHSGTGADIECCVFPCGEHAINRYKGASDSVACLVSWIYYSFPPLLAPTRCRLYTVHAAGEARVLYQFPPAPRPRRFIADRVRVSSSAQSTPWLRYFTSPPWPSPLNCPDAFSLLAVFTQRLLEVHQFPPVHEGLAPLVPSWFEIHRRADSAQQKQQLAQ
jgi:hypothetical protein